MPTSRASFLAGFLAVALSGAPLWAGGFEFEVIGPPWDDPSCSAVYPQTEVKRFSSGFFPRAFVANHGQWKLPILYRCRFDGAIAALDAEGLVLQFPKGVKRANGVSRAVRLSFVGGSATDVEGESPLPGLYNYLIGNDRARWRTGVPSYASVLYHRLYEGVNLRVRMSGSRLEYDFMLEPRADVQEIEVQCEGVDALEFRSDGALVLHTEVGSIVQPPPLAWNERSSGERCLTRIVLLRGLSTRQVARSELYPLKPMSAASRQGMSAPKN